MKIVNDIIEQIKKHDKIAIFHHKNIDGDSISSSYGLVVSLKKLFPSKEIYWIANEEYLDSHFPNLAFDKSLMKKEIDDTYLTIIGDTGEERRVEYYDEFAKGKFKICFDHHTSKPNLDVNIIWTEPKYPASSMQAYEIVEAMGIEHSEDTAFFLMIGLLTDTGWFRFSLADPRPVKVYSTLLEFISNDRMDSFLNGMSQNTKKDMEVKSYVLSSLQYGKNFSYIKVPAADLEKYGKEAIKSNIHLIGNIKDYPIWLHVIETNEDGYQYSINMRSNGININPTAVAHHGGGHMRASGCKVKDEKELEQLFKELGELK